MELPLVLTVLMYASSAMLVLIGLAFLIMAIKD